MLPVLDERVARLEGRVQEQAIQIADVRTVCAELRQAMHDLETGLRQEIRDLRDDVDRRFTWLIGIMVTCFVVTIGTIAGAFWGLLQTLR